VQGVELAPQLALAPHVVVVQEGHPRRRDQLQPAVAGAGDPERGLVADDLDAGVVREVAGGGHRAAVVHHDHPHVHVDLR
jgi:hypothetical protein